MRRGTRIAASLIVMAAAVPASGAAAAPESGAPAAAPAIARLARCADDRSARCGSLRVPVYRGVRGSGRLTVRFRVYPRTDRSRPALEPIVTVEGGPGYPSIGSADYYLFMLGRLRARHDVIVMDNRGTGSSGAINCPRLQEGKGVYAREVGRCARKLGRRANAYGTGAAADDLAALLDKLHVPVVDVYGDSYGTYFAQTFAVRHPQRVRAVVLDAAFGVDYFDFWTRQESRALRFAWPAVCLRSTGCAGAPNRDVLAQLRHWAVRLERRPIRGVGRDADGGRHRIKLDGANLAQMAGDASYYYSLYRDLSAALSAAGRGDLAPLLRLAAEDRRSPAAVRSRSTRRVRTRRWPAMTTRSCGTRPPRSPPAALSSRQPAPRSSRTRSRRSRRRSGWTRCTSTSSSPAACAGHSPPTPTRRCRRARPTPPCRCSCWSATSTRSRRWRTRSGPPPCSGTRRS
jgi:pimeloyl-ACP methyl ester carboxylesterase